MKNSTGLKGYMLANNALALLQEALQALEGYVGNDKSEELEYLKREQKKLLGDI